MSKIGIFSTDLKPSNKDQVHHLKTGDGFIIPPYTDNNYYPTHENPWVYKWIGINGSKSKELLNACGLLLNDNYIFNYTKDNQLNSLFDSMNTPQQYLIEFKLKKACDLLRKSSYSISEISSLSGFASQSYFSKVFKKNITMTPIEYKNLFIK